MTAVITDQTQVLDVIGDRLRVLVAEDDAGRSFEMFEVEGDHGSGPPPHAHPWAEAFYLLEGELLVEIEGVATTSAAGSAVVIPAGAVHRFEVRTPTARFITVSGGTGAAAFFRDLSAHAPGAPTPESLPAVIDVAKRNGLTSPLF